MTASPDFLTTNLPFDVIVATLDFEDLILYVLSPAAFLNSSAVKVLPWGVITSYA